MLVLLLAISLWPLAFVSWLDFQVTEQLGKNLAARTRDALTAGEKQKLRVWVDEKAAWVQSRGLQVEQTLRSQAREIERCLVSAPDLKTKAYFRDDFKKGILPPGVVESSRHMLYHPSSSQQEPIPVTYETQVFALAPGLTRKAAATDIARLAPMTSAYRFLLKNGPDIIFWQYTGFENGLFCAYPGDGTSPSDYDPRTRPWYRRAKEEDRLVWVGPYRDSVSGQIILTAAVPVHTPGGEIAGVTALDFSVQQLVENLRLPAGWPKDAHSALVGLVEENGKTDVQIYVNPGYFRLDGSDPLGAFQAARLHSSDTSKFEDMVENMRHGVAGSDLMNYEGRLSLWAYGPARSEGMYLVVIIPYDQVIAEALAAQQESLHQTQSQLRHIEIVGSVVVALVLLLSLLSARAISKPVQELAAATRRVADGELGTRVNIRTHDEIQELGEAFNRMVPQLQDGMHLKQSLELAREVQQQLLPREAPRIDGFDITGTSVYCDETGGDYFDFIEFTRGERPRLAAIVGDITGHGISSALLMATARALLRADIADVASVSELLARVNAQLARDVTGGKFMTLYFLEIETASRVARWSSAGHDPAIRYDPAHDSFDEFTGSNLPLAIDPEAKYEEGGPVPLQSGQVIVIGTDGVWEAPNLQGERFGKDRLRAVMREHARESSEEIQTAVMNAVTAFRGSQPQADDITLVVIKIA